MRRQYLVLVAAFLAGCATAPPPEEPAAQVDVPVAAQWARHTLRYPQAVPRSDNARRVLERLGAREVDDSSTQVTFLVLVPASSNNAGVVDPPIIQARWKKVTFRANSSTRIYRDGLDTHIYDVMENSILKAFTTRNFDEQTGGRMSVEVLFPAGE